MGWLKPKKLDECEFGFLKQHPQGFLAKALVGILWFFFGHGGGSSRASFATAAPTPYEAPFFFSTEGHQSAVFKANFMQFSKLIWYYLM